MGENTVRDSQTVQTVRQLEPVRETRVERPVGLSKQSVLFGAVVLAMLACIGTGLVWYATHLTHDLMMEDIRAACTRIMPETIQRCVDTVIIQRGGAR